MVWVEILVCIQICAWVHLMKSFTSFLWVIDSPWDTTSNFLAESLEWSLWYGIEICHSKGRSPTSHWTCPWAHSSSSLVQAYDFFNWVKALLFTRYFWFCRFSFGGRIHMFSFNAALLSWEYHITWVFQQQRFMLGNCDSIHLLRLLRWLLYGMWLHPSITQGGDTAVLSLMSESLAGFSWTE